MPVEPRARAHEARPGHGRERSPSILVPRNRPPAQPVHRGRSQGSTPRRGDVGGPSKARSLAKEERREKESSLRAPTGRAYEDYVVYRGNKKGNGIGLRRSMDLQDVDPEYCVHWGKKIRGREVAEGWLELASGGYIPMDIEGTRLVMPARVRSPFRGRGQVGGARSSGHAAEPGPRPYDDYIVYRGNKNGIGIGLRLSMDLQDLHPEHCVSWGMEIRGREVADGWLELASGGFIPMDIEGTRLVVPASARREADWSPVRGSGRNSGARSSGHAAKPGSRQQAFGKKRRQSPEVAGRRAEPKEGRGGKPGVSWAGGPPRQMAGARPEGDAATELPHEGLRKLFCKYDDAYFRDTMPDRLGAGWQELSPRQLKRQVCKWRKSQHRWRFPVEGGFRAYVLLRMPEHVWRKLPDGQQEGYWQSFHYGGQKPAGADASESPGEQPERSRGPGILRSRPRSRPESVHRRIAGLSPSEDREL